MKRKTMTAALLFCAVLLSSCNKAEEVHRGENGDNHKPKAERVTSAPTEAKTRATAEPETEARIMETMSPEEEESYWAALTATEPPTEPETDFTGDYVHGTDGYFCLADTAVSTELRMQKSGTCWAFASSAAIENSFFLNTGRKLEIDPLAVVNRVYGPDKTEGMFINEGRIAENIGGCWEFVAELYSSGVDGVYAADAFDLEMGDREDIKEAIKNYGGAIATLDETASKRQLTHGYLTFNNPKPSKPDHELLIIGWDDNFPKSYFKKKAEQNGAWIAYNSNIGEFGYYYISYDTVFDGLSVISATDKYTACESYDTGNFYGRTLDLGKETDLANVFHRAGTLAAVGTFCNGKKQSIVIEIYDTAFTELLYSQKAKMTGYGWHIIDLDQPLSVTDCAVVVRYGGDAPLEADWETSDFESRAVIEPGQSFVKSGGKWLDLADEDTAEAIGVTYEPKNCCIKAYYK